ncbi:MAG: hypothetical protein JXA71_13780, partial [Chitinispirillaceae bacterium]|nr:hypothetical protein [Chitinispirillaceae bacterium]
MRFVPLIFLGTALFAVTASAETGFSVNAEINIKKSQADSLQQKADSLENEASRLEDRLDDIQEARKDRKDLKDDLEDQIKELQEELDDLKERIDDAREEIQDKVEDLQDVKDDLDEKMEEERHIGSFILTFEYSHLDVDPLKYLVRNDRSLQGARDKFDFSNNQMMMFGLMGYYNMENNVRVGNGFYTGYKLFQSDAYTGIHYDSLHIDSMEVDSVITLRVIPAYIGFICEKAFVYDPVNFFAGIMLGGNMTILVKEDQQMDQTSSFIRDEYEEDQKSRFSVAL